MWWFSRKKKEEVFTHVLYKTCIYTGGRIYGERYSIGSKGGDIACLIVFDKWKPARITDQLCGGPYEESQHTK